MCYFFYIPSIVLEIEVNKLCQIRGNKTLHYYHTGYLKFRLNEVPRVDVSWSCSRSLDVLP